MVESSSKPALGRGLSVLLDDLDLGPEPAASGDGLRILAIELVIPNPDQPRRYFDEEELNDLAASIKDKGIIQPIIVRPSKNRAGEFEIIAGERRWRASQRARLHEIPVIVREFDDTEALEIAIIENVQRADLNAMEEAAGYRQLVEKYSYTQETLSKSIGKSRSHIANIMRLLNLPNSVQELVRSGALSGGHARALLTASDAEGLAKLAVERNMSVREVEAAAKAPLETVKNPPKVKAEKDADTLALEGDLSAALRMAVSIQHKGKAGGELKISYRSLEDLDRLCARLMQEEAL
ncbi:MAG: ParB/RepB/Spo0J family partition protein [Neomegalonema sp.]|nr:ParB/RepB/Spo0J family partition protein [Neomegalonema sp.]